MYLTVCTYIFIKRIISDESLFETGQIHLLPGDVVQSHSYLGYSGTDEGEREGEDGGQVGNRFSPGVETHT